MQKPAATPFWLATVLAGGLALATCAPAIASADTPVRPSAFMQCTACHTTTTGKHGVGPSLAGVFGRKAGTETGYTYSNALKSSGITWDEASLDRWLTSPAKTVPGNKMPFAGVQDTAKRQAIITYLKSFK